MVNTVDVCKWKESDKEVRFIAGTNQVGMIWKMWREKKSRKDRVMRGEDRGGK